MSKTTRYIAAVVVTCYVDGVRTNLQPGDEVPADLPKHDIEQLLRMKAVRDPGAEKAQAADMAKAVEAADADFAAARASVQAATESTAPPAADKAAPAAKSSKAKA